MAQKSAFENMLETLIDKNVPTVNSTFLYNQINYHKPLILLDAREMKEYKVSHIKDAICVGYDNFNIEEVSNIPKNKEIVVYCSVGYRSEKIGEILQNSGYKKVKNLYGGIFDWINKDYPVVDSLSVTRKIHPYNEEWGKWLEKGEKVYGK